MPSITAVQLIKGGAPAVNLLKLQGFKLSGVNEKNQEEVSKILKANSLKLEDVESNGRSTFDASSCPVSIQNLVKQHSELVDKLNAELKKHFGAGKGTRCQDYFRSSGLKPNQ